MSSRHRVLFALSALLIGLLTLFVVVLRRPAAPRTPPIALDARSTGVLEDARGAIELPAPLDTADKSASVAAHVPLAPETRRPPSDKEAPTTRPTSTASSSTANLTIEIRGDGAFGGRVRLEIEGSRVRRAREFDSETRSVVFENLPRARGRVWLEGLSLGWLPARAQSQQAGVPGRSVDLTSGDNTAILGVELAAFVECIVNTPSGAPIWTVIEAVCSEDGVRHLEAVAMRPLRSGRPGAWLHEGTWILRVLESRAECVTPPPQEIELTPGENAVVVFEYQTGSRSLAGRIVDSTGAAVPRLAVHLDRLTTSEHPRTRTERELSAPALPPAYTDADGRFRFASLVPARYELHPMLAPPFSWSIDEDATRVDRLLVDVTTASSDHIVLVTRTPAPVVVSGRILFDESLGDVKLGDIDVDVRVSEEPWAGDRGRLCGASPVIVTSPTGGLQFLHDRFEFRIDRSFVDARIRIEHRSGGRRREYPALVGRSAADSERVLRFP